MNNKSIKEKGLMGSGDSHQIESKEQRYNQSERERQ